jgi:hypothetical protein
MGGADAGGVGPIKGPGSTGCSGTTRECAAAAASDKLVLFGRKLMVSPLQATVVVLSFLFWFGKMYVCNDR